MYSLFRPRRMTREAANPSTPGVGDIKKSTTPVFLSAEMRSPISPVAVFTYQQSRSRRTALANPTAQRGRFRGSATNWVTLAGSASIEIVFVSARIGWLQSKPGLVARLILRRPSPAVVTAPHGGYSHPGPLPRERETFG